MWPLLLLASALVDLPPERPPVPFVPTPALAAAQALSWIGLGPGDAFIDLGCGDGRVAAEALKLGANVTCVELRSDIAQQAELTLRAVARGSASYRVLQQDLFTVDLSEFTAVFFYLLPDAINGLTQRLAQSLRDGARVLSREFEILGWPCGDRLRSHDSLFLKWEAPIAVSVEAATRGRDASAEASSASVSAEEHLLDCAAEEAVEEDEPAGGRGRIGRMYSSRARRG